MLPSVCWHPIGMCFNGPCISLGHTFILILVARRSITHFATKASFSPNTSLLFTDLNNASTITISLCFSHMKITENYGTFLMHVF